MKKIIIIFVSVLLFSIGAVGSFFFVKDKLAPKEKELPLLKYTFENLKNTKFESSPIEFGEIKEETETYISRIFYFNVPEKPNSSETLKVSGLANIPKTNQKFPVVIMFRGYMPKENYKSGGGSQPSAKVLASKGLMTLAPDFLGYGESASPSAVLFEDRFQTYLTALTLLNSIDQLNEIGADTNKVGVWGHSNGGQIALSTMAISGKNYPTVLWAPVSKPFPYSILFYTDETDDHGKALRKALSLFEKDYDIELFSPFNYYSWIKAPVQIHQGTNDEEVLFFWTDELVNTLKQNNIEVEYYKYQGDNHNLLPSGWSSAVTREIEFFNKNFTSEKR